MFIWQITLVHSGMMVRFCEKVFIAQNSGLAGTGPRAPLSPITSLSWLASNCKNSSTQNPQCHVLKYYTVTADDRTLKHTSLQTALWLEEKTATIVQRLWWPQSSLLQYKQWSHAAVYKMEDNWLAVPLSALGVRTPTVPTTPSSVTHSPLNRHLPVCLECPAVLPRTLTRPPKATQWAISDDSLVMGSFSFLTTLERIHTVHTHINTHSQYGRAHTHFLSHLLSSITMALSQYYAHSHSECVSHMVWCA